MSVDTMTIYAAREGDALVATHEFDPTEGTCITVRMVDGEVWVEIDGVREPLVVCEGLDLRVKIYANPPPAIGLTRIDWGKAPPSADGWRMKAGRASWVQIVAMHASSIHEPPGTGLETEDVGPAPDFGCVADAFVHRPPRRAPA